ncbi:RHS repeat-associated core domain-containing protein [Rubripirellula lacrimiformis]|nr:RHS repeat-associated core domain-containing protein [Rubripirellula lacrimiformis]
MSNDAYFSHGQSRVFNVTYNYFHNATDYSAPDGYSTSIKRFHRSRDLTEVSSFGPGVFSSCDIRFQFNSLGGINTSIFKASIFDPSAASRVEFRYQLNLAEDAVSLIPSDRSRFKKIEILDDQLAAIEAPLPGYYDIDADAFEFAGAEFARATSWNGDIFLFELVVAEAYPGFDPAVHHPQNGRLIEAHTRDGNGYTINYKTWTQPQIDAAPDRLWQIDTVVDSHGQTLTFDYNAQQQSGLWAVSRITLPNSDYIDYGYAGGFLSTVDYPDGTQTTISYAAGTNGLVEMDFEDVAAAPKHRRKTVSLTGSVATVNGSVVPTAVGLTRVVVNGEDEVTYLNGAGESSIKGVIYEGGGRLKQTVQNLDTFDFAPEIFYQDGWSIAEEMGEMTLTGQAEPIFQLETGISMKTGNPEASRDSRGVFREFEYDSNGSLTFIHYSDGSTFEAFCYDGGNNLIRMRDRNGNVTRYTYDSAGRMLTKAEGLVDGVSNPGDVYSSVYNRCPTDDVQTAEYAVETFTYISPGNDGEGRIESKTDPLGNVTNYEYDSLDRLKKIIQPTASLGGSRPETAYAYKSDGRLDTVVDPAGHTTQFFYDSRGREISRLYDDGTSDRTIYGVTGDSTGLVVKRINRAKVVSTFEYDKADRLVEETKAAAVIDDSDTEVATSDIAIAQTMEYLNGTDSVVAVRQSGDLTEYLYDSRGRRIGTFVNSSDGGKQATQLVFRDNKLLSREDSSGRKTFHAYDATDGRLIRTVTGLTAEFSLADYAAVNSLVRDSGPNADYLISDRVYRANGTLEWSYDGRNSATTTEYDSRNRAIAVIADADYDDRSTLSTLPTAMELRTETDCDLASNVTEVRSPRYFDSGDSEGYQKAKETWTYNGRGLTATHTEAPGTAEAATESFAYDLLGRRIERTDFAGKVWKTHYEDCCGQVMASENPLGHGSIVRKDAVGRTIHQVSIEDYTSHVASLDDPVNAKTLREMTTKYDGRGRPVARTTWLVARGTVDATDPPIAGLGGVSATDGLTEQFLYDDDLTDDVGLDSSGGMTLLIGSDPVSLSAALTKLADTEANGGAGVSFDADATGSARVTINPEGEVRYAISDAAGRSVMSGVLKASDSSLITWNCSVHDATTTVSGFGTVLVSKSVNALGKVSQRHTDAAGRTIQSLDALGKITSYEFDAAGNQLKVRDPNGVGQDCTYDALGRDLSCTDTSSAVVSSSYDTAGNKIAATDTKSETTTYAFDARGRQVMQTDRLGGETEFAYSATGQLLSLTDAQDQVTSYTYDDAGTKLTETYPDHVPSSTPGQTGYGIVSFTPDATGRTEARMDQQGDTCTYAYDLAGRLLDKVYAANASGPLSGQGHTDTFTYDDAGRTLTAVSGRYANTVTYTYDDAGRKATEALTMGGQTYTTATGYDAVGQVSGYTYPDGTAVARTYSDRGQLATIAYASTTVDTRTYDDGGRMTGSAYNNGVSATRAYNTDNTLASITHSGAAVGNYTYGWDSNKNKTSEAITGTLSGYGFDVGSSGYDDEDRLVNWERDDSSLDQSWNLSLVGDWNSFTENASSQARTHGPTHEMLTVAGQAVTHDTKGNTTSIPAVLRPGSDPLAMKWDFENKLIGADIDNDATDDVTYQWDALLRRVGRDDGTTASIYVQNGQQTVADYTSGTAASSPTYNYVYASYIDEPVLRGGTGGLRYYHRNQQYSVTAMTNGGGTVSERYAYDAYGTPTTTDASGTSLTTSTENNRYTYTGREYDEALGLYHYRARMYDSESGRFCSRDPIGHELLDIVKDRRVKEFFQNIDWSLVDDDVFENSTFLKVAEVYGVHRESLSLGNPGQETPLQKHSYGLYGYVESNPITWVDPSGNWPLCSCGCVPAAPAPVPLPLPMPWWLPPVMPGITFCGAFCGSNGLCPPAICSVIPCARESNWIWSKSTNTWTLLGTGGGCQI